MIEVVHDQERNWAPADRCASCKTKTRYWHAKNDVAVCTECAKQVAESQVPCKRDWLNANRLPGKPPLPDNWTCNADRNRIAVATHT